jgi:hypothetical protein
MSIIDPITGVDEESSPISLSQCYTKAFPRSAPIGETVLSTAIASYARQDASHRMLGGLLTPQMHQKDSTRRAMMASGRQAHDEVESA